MAAMERDYYYPALSDRQDPVSWMEEGKRTILEKANERARMILEDHHPEYIDPKADADLRSRFNILLP